MEADMGEGHGEDRVSYTKHWMAFMFTLVKFHEPERSEAYRVMPHNQSPRGKVAHSFGILRFFVGRELCFT